MNKRTQLDLNIQGMNCASCVGHVERALAGVAGVSAVSVNLAAERAHLTLSQSVPVARLVAAVEQAGYLAAPVTATTDLDNAARRERELQDISRNFRYALALTLPVFLLEMGAHLVPPLHHWLAANLGIMNWYIQFTLTTLVLFGPGQAFFRQGLPALARLRPDMNSLVAIGSFAAWSYSVVATFLPNALPVGTVNVYYEAAAVIVTLILLGRLLEARARGRTSDAIARLVKLQPNTATVMRNGAVQVVDSASVREGDVLLVKPGEKIPVDGELIEGSSFVDEAMMTGESMPVRKAPGDILIGGTLNKNGSLTYRATRVGSDTMLAQIIKLVEEAQGSKLPIQALVDQITRWFVPAVLALAGITFGVWFIWGPEPALTFALVNAVAVLIIACPCAMGLATPTSIMVGTGRAASLGLLFRRGSALQMLAGIKTIAFDKTGTLTIGEPQLTDFVAASGFDKRELLALAAAAEQHSEHPIARALLNAATTGQIKIAELQNFEAVPGYGLCATVSGKKVHIGADRYFAKIGLDQSAFSGAAENLARAGKTPIYMAVDNQVAAVMALADTIKPGAPAVIKSLHALGFQIAMITGDNKRTAEVIAQELGIDRIVAEVLPDQKVDAVKELRTQYGAIAYVGDGINDAPALAEADLGLAIGTGTDVAIESADLVLVSGDLAGVPNSIALARATMRNIKQNLFWAFVYNAALIPLAAGLAYPAFGILLSPMLAAGAMALSSVFVVTNALRLRSWQPNN